VLAAFQDAFVALVTEPTCDPARFDLEAHELAALRAIPAAELERYARSLIEKRWGELQRVVALTARVAPSLGDRYRAWARVNPAPVREDVLSPGAAEALRALPAVGGSVGRRGGRARHRAKGQKRPAAEIARSAASSCGSRSKLPRSQCGSVTSATSASWKAASTGAA